MLDDLKKIHERDAQDALGTVEKRWLQHDEAVFLRSDMQTWLPTSPTKQNLAKQIALECIGRSVVVYASPLISNAARHWKQGFNTYARQLAWVGELSPSELLSWTRQPQQKPYAIIDIVSSLETPDTIAMFSEASRLLSGMRPEPIRIDVPGTTESQQATWTACLGDFATIYTALLSGINPTPGNNLNIFKTILEDI